MVGPVTHAIEGYEALVLTTETGRALLAEVAEVARAGPSDLARWRNFAPSEWVSAALRLVEGRRKGAAKFTRADRMWFDPVGVEQATAETVARHKARRFADGNLVVDLCSGIGGDSLALAGSNPVIAVDLDAGMGRRTLWNAGIYEVDDRVMAVQCRAESFPIPDGSRVHIDPDRRAGNRSRARSVVDYVPGLEYLLGLTTSTVGGALKIGPASDFQAHFGAHEIEVISLGGECKESTVWYGDLMGPKVRRRATCLPIGATWTDLDGPTSAFVATGPLEAWVFDPDPSLARAGLLDGFASHHGLRRIVDRVDLLTAPSRVESPFLAAFEVIEIFPLDLKVLRREVASRALGPLDIKTRGLTTTPESYRNLLRPKGPNPATLLLIADHSGPSRAILARRA
jgi:THUMP domain-like/RNA cap guanine-N2 methyltransferase